MQIANRNETFDPYSCSLPILWWVQFVTSYFFLITSTQLSPIQPEIYVRWFCEPICKSFAKLSSRRLRSSLFNESPRFESTLKLAELVLDDSWRSLVGDLAIESERKWAWIFRLKDAIVGKLDAMKRQDQVNWSDVKKRKTIKRRALMTTAIEKHYIFSLKLLFINGLSLISDVSSFWSFDRFTDKVDSDLNNNQVNLLSHFIFSTRDRFLILCSRFPSRNTVQVTI